jgi:hypothetical protein
MPQDLELVQFLLTTSLREKLDDRSAKNGISRDELVARALDAYLAEEDYDDKLALALKQIEASQSALKRVRRRNNS